MLRGHITPTSRAHSLERASSRPVGGATPAAPIAIPRSSVTSLRDELSSVASFRLGSRFGDPLGDNAPPIISTPPVRRPSLSHNLHGHSTNYFPQVEMSPCSPSPYEREEVLFQNYHSLPISRSTYQRLAVNSAFDPTPQREEALLESSLNVMTIITMEPPRTSSRTPLRAHPNSDGTSPASEPC
jgi:hypothetical protein